MCVFMRTQLQALALHIRSMSDAHGEEKNAGLLNARSGKRTDGARKLIAGM